MGGAVAAILTPSAAPLLPFALFLIIAGLPTFAYALNMVLFTIHTVLGEMLVLTPSGLSRAFLQRHGLRLANTIQTFAYHEVEHIARQRRWWGAYRLNLMGNGKQASFDIPVRLGQRGIIVQSILADWRATRQETAMATVPAVPLGTGVLPAPPSILSIAPPPTSLSAPLIARPTYTIVASPADVSLLNDLATWLARRGIAPIGMSALIRDEGILAPAPVNMAASTVVFIVASEAVFRSPYAQGLIAEAVRRQQPLIPLRTVPQAQLPGDLGRFQWIDFSPASDHANSLLDLCDALDRLGCITPPSATQLDVEWVMARAKHQRPLPDWRVYWAEPNIVQVQTRSRRGFPKWTFVAIVGVVLFQFWQKYVQPMGDAWVTLVWTTLLVGIATTFVFITTYRRQQRRARFSEYVQQHYFAPSMVVLTPQGLIIHALANGSRFIDYAVPLPMLIRAEAKNTAFGPTDLVLTTQQGPKMIAAPTSRQEVVR